MRDVEVPDLLKGSIRMYIMYKFGRTPQHEEVDKLAAEWIKTPHIPLKKFMEGRK